MFGSRSGNLQVSRSTIGKTAEEADDAHALFHQRGGRARRSHTCDMRTRCIAEIDNPLLPPISGSRWVDKDGMAEMICIGDNVTVAYGACDDVMPTKVLTPLEPDVVEETYSAPGLGVVLEDQSAGVSGRTDLVSFAPGA
jgi:hypothetical protein